MSQATLAGEAVNAKGIGTRLVWPRARRYIRGMSQVETIKAQAAQLSAAELGEVTAFLEKLQRQARRKQAVEAVCGKYQDALRPSAEFMHDKAEEKRLEERPWRS